MLPKHPLRPLPPPPAPPPPGCCSVAMGAGRLRERFTRFKIITHALENYFTSQLSSKISFYFYFFWGGLGFCLFFWQPPHTQNNNQHVWSDKLFWCISVNFGPLKWLSLGGPWSTQETSSEEESEHEDRPAATTTTTTVFVHPRVLKFLFLFVFCN